MRLAMTMMVRDEADIVVPMIEYHLHAGVDVFLITDNGSVDGTRDLLSSYESDDRVVVIDDPVHDKNQSQKVTAMARRAADEFGADWVINADADEFFVPRNRSLALRDLFEAMPRAIGSATVSVVDMTGVPAKHGAGIGRLDYRDERPLDRLYETSGLHAHATHDSFHIGSGDVVVAQGNHYVSIPSQGPVPPELVFESIHYPWRSYSQFERKVRNAGEAYARNPHLKPSPRHHGIRDYGFLQAGVLEDLYLYRHPVEIDETTPGFSRDRWLIDHLLYLAGNPATRNPREIEAALVVDPDTLYDGEERERRRAYVPALLALESRRAAAQTEAREAAERAADALKMDAALRSEIEALQEDRSELAARLDAIRRSRAYALSVAVSQVLHLPARLYAALRARFSRPSQPGS